MIKIYTVAGCEACEQAISFSKFKKIPHEVVLLSEQHQVEELRSKLNGRNLQVPLMFDDEKYIGHFKEYKEWEKKNGILRF